jgi:hypothetical protein
MTFVCLDASMIVGEIACESIGSTTARSGCSSSLGSLVPTSRRKASASGSVRVLGLYSASRWMSLAARTSALSAIPGIDACPLRPCTRRTNGELIFSAVPHR